MILNKDFNLKKKTYFYYKILNKINLFNQKALEGRKIYITSIK